LEEVLIKMMRCLTTVASLPLITWHLLQEHRRTLVLLFLILLLNILRQNHGTTAVAVDTVILATTLTQGPHLPSITVPEEGKALVVV
jgi:hypothetical protein